MIEKNFRNPSSQMVLRKYHKEAQQKLDDMVRKVTPLLKENTVSEIRGLKGAMSLMSRVTGIDVELGWDDNSEVDLIMRDKFKATGLQAKLDKINALYESQSIRLDMVQDAVDAEMVIADFKKVAKAILEEGVTPVSIW
jgi:hypothetical protein